MIGQRDSLLAKLSSTGGYLIDASVAIQKG
jgi:hypothetical protein